MGNLLGCFGKSKGHSRHGLAQGASTPEARFVIAYGTGTQDCSSSQVNSEEESISLVEELEVANHEKQSNTNPRRKVTFDSNVRIYDHIPPADDTPFTKSNRAETDRKDIKTISNRDSIVELDHSLIVPGSSRFSTSTTSSSASYYPANHRYHNYRESDDEDNLNDEFFDPEENYNEDDEDEIRSHYDEDDQFDDHIPTGQDLTTTASCSSTESGASRSSTVYAEKSEHSDYDSLDGQKPILEENSRSIYNNNNHPVLNPVENLTHLRAAAKMVKLLPSPQSKQQKENSLSLEENLLETKLSHLVSNLDVEKTQEPTTDASLSSWLVLSQKGLSTSKQASSKQYSSSCQFNPMTTDRENVPILGALTVEDLEQYSSSSSSTPLIKTIDHSRNSEMTDSTATNWSVESPVMGAGFSSASSFKGIPNTTSKYREDKTVNWHSTPFETRLERAMKRGAMTNAHGGGGTCH